jgi:glutathione synthase/RimK-type ligase-like ATP-grasp enzyme
MKRGSIGILFDEQKDLGEEEKIFINLAKRKKINLVMINVAKTIDEKEIEEKIKNCKVIFNNTAENIGIELAKTLKVLGKKVIESPEKYYFIEDKWMFFIECKKNKIPVPETILLPENLEIAKKELKKFGRWPVILKRVYGTCGEYVEKADNLNQAEKIIKKFWKKGSERLPIIAQEFIHSPSYRVTIIKDKVVQTAIKENIGWKATGVYGKKFKKFKVDSKLRKIIKKVNNFSKMGIYGIDLLKKEEKWIVLEINAEPGLDFFKNERKKLIGKVLNFLNSC